ncbi:MAG: T9SS type A sorting domain-containing protein [Ignavibacteriae bacterium]|nr:T9SS type A sorting domain-containing protein [Ignavibacteriota bacterium]MCB0723379.1 T9SS type A sorting domain-containing protein [Ignavibacteriota bacterium]MCB9243225.1 T9SS type A sorting domain-containing protein [Ignavibacteriales bacterium]
MIKKYLLHIILIAGFILIGIRANAGENEIPSSQLDGFGSGNSAGNVDDYKLYQNYPNPFNPVTKISYKINNEGFVSLKVYNLVGQVVGVLVNENQEPGTYSVIFNGNQLTTGIYLYKLQVNGFTTVKRMTLIK